ncbi:hypothetical protein Tco_0210939 [Tanacetum coccineum]
MRAEELILYQKAKVKWLSVGDRNNAYFHKAIKSTIQSNKIDAINDEDGNRYEGVEVVDQFVKHFKKFLGKSRPVDPIHDMDSLFKSKLSFEEAGNMVRDVSDEEIKLAMFQIDDNKAPGPDVSILKDAIEEFGRVAGLLPNYNKSTIMFGGLTQEEQKDILDITPFKVEKLPIKYLGVPITSKRLGIKECKCLIDKVESRVTNWKNKSLTYAGRLMLVALVLESIHVYWASVFLLPMGVINNINRLITRIGQLNGLKKIPNLLTIQYVHLDKNKKDKIMWKNKDVNLCNFMVKQAYSDLLVDEVDNEWRYDDWKSTISEFARSFNGNLINIIIRRLSLAASVYLIWQERNRRIFKDEKRNVDELFSIFKDTIRLRLVSLKVKDSYVVKTVQKE